MKARLLFREKRIVSESRFVDIVIWRLPKRVQGSSHDFKYRLALIVDEVCVLRFDNEAGKGDHKHMGMRQMPYTFAGLSRLIDDFWRDVEKWGSK